MKTSMPRWFTALLVAVLILCSVTVAAFLFHQAKVTEDIAQAKISLEAVQGRLRKQQQEYAEALEALPAALAELETLQPQAQAAYEQEQSLRQQRKDLRAENAAQADEIAALTAKKAEDSDAAATLEAIQQLEAALSALQQLYLAGQ